MLKDTTGKYTLVMDALNLIFELERRADADSLRLKTLIERAWARYNRRAVAWVEDYEYEVKQRETELYGWPGPWIAPDGVEYQFVADAEAAGNLVWDLAPVLPEVSSDYV